MPNRLRTLAMLAIAAFVAACGGDPRGTKGTAGRSTAEISLKNDVQPIIRQFCRCHVDSPSPAGHLDLTGYDQMMKGGRAGPQIVPGKPDTSGLYRRVQTGAMPPTGKLADSDIKIIHDWIEQGAQNN